MSVRTSLKRASASVQTDAHIDPCRLLAFPWASNMAFAPASALKGEL